MGWESQTAGLPSLSAETIVAIKAQELICREWACIKVGMEVLLSDQKMVFMFAEDGCQTRFWQRKMMRRPVQLKPLILSVVSGFQLFGMQLRLASAQVNLFWTPHHFHKLPCTQYGGFARCFDLVEVAASECDPCFRGFFFFFPTYAKWQPPSRAQHRSGLAKFDVAVQKIHLRAVLPEESGF